MIETADVLDNALPERYMRTEINTSCMFTVFLDLKAMLPYIVLIMIESWKIQIHRSLLRRNRKGPRTLCLTGTDFRP